MRLPRPRLSRLVAVTALVAAAGLTATTLSAPAVAEPSSPRAGRTVTVPGSFTGYGFDACRAPSQQVMDAWRVSSPYAAVGIYIGGSNRLCPQDELDADWVRTQVRRGWHLLPIQVGPQAACTTYANRMSTDLRTATSQGRAEAAKAVANAQALAIGRGSTLYYDLESYDLGPDDCRQAALSFLSGWTSGLHSAGYDSGVYSSLGAAIHSLDYANDVSRGSYLMPDDIWFAWANGRADTATGDKVVTDEWDGHERIHQYQIDVSRKHGGERLAIDLNWVDVGRGSTASPTRRMCPGVDVDLRRYPTLKQGSRGEAVRAAQCLLRKARFGKVATSGRFDPRTAQAVKKAQRSFDQPTTGRLTKKTWVALLAKGSHPLIKVGSTGEPVRRVQRSLTAALGRRVPVTGLLDKSTAKAVEAYQRKARLDRTGVVDAATWNRLADKPKR